jgi:hypothetical protein
MGIVNATPDSFSDRQGAKDLDELAERGLRLVEDGAAIVDVGGESGRTDTEAVPVEEEIARWSRGRAAGRRGALGLGRHVARSGRASARSRRART